MGASSRRHDMDWLRVFATYLVIFFHVTKVFDVAPFYHIKNGELAPSLDLLTLFIHFWHMPLFFALAGWSLHASMCVRGADGMLRERSRRLLVPALAGIVLLCPVIKYFELRSGISMGLYGLSYPSAPFTESFVQFLPSFFTLPRFTWAHLWFLVYLFTFTMAYRGFFARLLADTERYARPSVAGLYRPLILLAGIQVTLRLVWPGGQNLVWDWANFAYYSSFFVLGFILAARPAWEEVIASEWKRAGLIALAADALMAAYWVAVAGQVWPERPTLLAVLRLLPVLALTAVAGYCTVIAMIGFSGRYLRFGGRRLAYLAESSLPVYILHQACVVVPGYYILRLPLGFTEKYSLLMIVAYALTVAVYHFIVRPAPWLRVLLGMKARATGGPQRPLARRTAGGGASAALLLVILLAPDASPAAQTLVPQSGPQGTWYADRGFAKVEVGECGRELCGRIVWLRSPFDEHGCELRDVNNGDPALRERRVEGLEILSGFPVSPDDDGVWSGGTVYDPASGRRYSATLRLEGEDRLLLRGYVGIPLLGRTEVWFRVGSENRMCEQGPR